MTYAQRLRFATVCSVLLHAALLLPWVAWLREPGLGPAPQLNPIVLNLQPPRVRQLVDAHTPAEEPVEETDLISDINSKAMDEEIREGEDPGPRFDETGDFDALALAEPLPEPEPAPPQPPMPPPPEAEPEPEPERMAEPVEAPDAPLEAAPPEPPAVPIAPEPEPERFQVAQAPRAALRDPLDRRSRGRLHDDVKKEGLSSFEALQDEIAPYMREVRRRVERRWNEALITRYAGTSPTTAVIDCAIGADGNLVSVEIVGQPADRLFAALCEAAVKNAGPFGKFPFEVPDLYRNKHLEIRWTFNYLRGP